MKGERNFKTFEELKEELGDKFEEYMYKANINLLNKLHEIKEYVKADYDRNKEVVDYCGFDYFYNHILELLKEIE